MAIFEELDMRTDRTEFIKNREIIDMSVSEVGKMLKTLRDVFDMVIIVDPVDQQIWDIDAGGEFKPVIPCYQMWGKSEPCKNCIPLKACHDVITADKYDTIGDEVYHIMIKPIRVDGHLFAFEINTKLDEAESINRRSILLQEQERNMEVIKILASEYSSVYYIDLTTDELKPYAMNKETESEFGQIFNSGITYSEAFKMYVDRLIYSDDKEMMLQNGSVENICRQLKNQKTFITQYRSSDGRYSEMKFVKVGREKDEPTAVALGFADRDEVIRQEKNNKRNQEIIEILASEYTSVYFIDLTTDELTMYTANEETETTFGSVFRSGITYSEAFKLYVDRLVLDEDKAMMLKAGSTNNIVSELWNKKTFITQYRSAENKYSEMKFVKVGGDNDEPVAVALGFAEKDDQIRREQAIEAERKRNFDIIEILASEYSSVYYIDLETDELDPYTMNEETESEFGRIFRSGIRYSEAYRMYVDTLIFPEDKSMMLKAGSVGNIMTELKYKKTFITTYRSAEGHYSEMKFVKVGNEEGIPKAVALGFADKDEELRAKEEESKILQRNIDIIEILASEYSSVYYIDLTTDELDPYTMNAETESEFGSIFRSGIKYSEAFRMYVNMLVYPQDRTMMLRAGSIYNIIRELSTKKTFITTYRSDNEGDPHYCEMKFVKVGDEENPQAVALGFADKDDEIRAEIERKEILDRNMAVISGLTDDFGCVLYVDVDSSEEIHYRFDKTFESQIPGWKELNNFQLRLSTLAGTIMHPDDREAFLEATSTNVIMDRIRNGEAYYINFRTLVDGETTYYQVKFAKDENTDNHIIVGFHNVDAETKREMAALEKAEAANRAKTTFLNSMSHDIRTPMNAIIGFTNMAEKQIDSREKVKECLDKVKSSGEHLLKLINDVLDMARVESGKTDFDVEPVDVLEAADDLVTMIRQDAEEKGLEFRFSADGLRDRYVFADKLHVNQVILNVLSNAVKYTKTGWVSYSVVQNASPNEYTGSYDFIIEDTGIGMSRELVETVFDSFVRAETATRSGIQGTGLGMSITKTLIDAMNGTIHIDSTPGVGTKVVIHFDFKFASRELLEKENAEVEVDGEIFKGKKVLLVEDNEMNREIATAILEENGLIVDTAEDGTVAVEIMKNSPEGIFDFVLMDIQMPVMDGYEATRQIRDLDSAYCKNVPIIAMTANAFEEDRKLALEAGMNEHIAKPIDVSRMKTTIAKFI
ncbi:MAG: response regulator [Eubacteriales bacterium]|nr:response regulator [Eubacteriales bacterium]